MRAFLTILGVVMGIMTVTGMSSIVAGLNASMAKQIATLGSSTIFIRPQAPGENIDDDEWRRRKGLTMDEVDAIAARPSVKAIAPLQFIPIENVKYGTERAREAQVLGTSPAYEEVHDTYVEKGRFLSATDVDRAAAVVVIGSDIADALFPFVDPVGKDISLDGGASSVIGVLQHKGKFLFRSMDNIVLVPVNSIQKQDRRFNFMMADVKPVNPGEITNAIDQTREAMRRYRKLKYMQKDNFGDLRPGHAHRPLPPDHRRHLHGDDRDLLDRPPGRRGRRDEHHARVGHREDARDRRPQGARRDPARHPVAVPHRGDDPHRRRRRSSAS